MGDSGFRMTSHLLSSIERNRRIYKPQTFIPIPKGETVSDRIARWQMRFSRLYCNYVYVPALPPFSTSSLFSITPILTTGTFLTVVQFLTVAPFPPSPLLLSPPIVTAPYRLFANSLIRLLATPFSTARCTHSSRVPDTHSFLLLAMISFAYTDADPVSLRYYIIYFFIGMDTSVKFMVMTDLTSRI